MDHFTTMSTVTEETSFMMTTPNYTSDLHTTDLDPHDPTDLHKVGARIKAINDLYRKIAYLPLTTFGLAGNALALWVWSAESGYNSTVFMLKALAVCDFLFLLGHLIYHAAELGAGISTSSFPHLFLSLLVILSQICSVYTTLLSSLTRLLAIFRPAHFNTILSRPRVIALCVAIFTWSLLLSALEASWYVCLLVKGHADCLNIYQIVDFYRQHYIFDLLASCLPSFLLLSCNVLILWKFSRHRREVSGSSSNQKNDDRTRRLSITMVTISVTSLVTYPVAVSVRLGLNPGQIESDACDLICYNIVVYSCGILTMFNSCINVVYYLVISSRFRELLKFRVDKLFRCCTKM